MSFLTLSEEQEKELTIDIILTMLLIRKVFGIDPKTEGIVGDTAFGVRKGDLRKGNYVGLKYLDLVTQIIA